MYFIFLNNIYVGLVSAAYHVLKTDEDNQVLKLFNSDDVTIGVFNRVVNFEKEPEHSYNIYLERSV